MIFQKGDICEGCSFDVDNHTTICTIRNKGKAKDCPCINCLVKVTCSDVCLLYHQLLIKIYKK